MKLAWLAAGAVAGVYLGGRATLPWLLWLVPLLLALAAAALFYRRGGTPLLAALALAALLLGMLRGPPPPDSGPGSLAHYNGSAARITAVVAEAEPAGRGQRLVLEARSVMLDGAQREVSGGLLAWTDASSEHAYGDIVVLTGALRAPTPRRDFDYPQYLAQQGIYSVVTSPKLEVLAHGEGFRPRAWLETLRRRLADGLARALPEPQSSLAQAVLLGLRRSMSAGLTDAFNRTGTTHILAVSGLNISIVAGLLLPLAAWALGKRRGLYLLLPLAGVWLYAFLAGMGPPVVRAAIMGSLFLWGHYLGRPGSTVTALALAGAVMVLLDPPVLAMVSFQLSFLSMVGLALLAPSLDAALQGWATRHLGENAARWTRPVTTGTAVSLAAMALTYPLIALYFQRVSLMGLPATLLLLPVLPVTLVTSALSAAAGAVSSDAGQVASWLAWPWLSYQAGLVVALARVPGIALDTTVSAPAIAGYYGLLAFVLVAWRRRRLPAWTGLVPAQAWARWAILLALSTAAVLVWAAALGLPDGRVHVSFLDVGQGDAILVQAGRRQVLVDGGPSPPALMTALGQQLPYWDRRLDVVVLSHPEADHLAGLVAVLDRYQVGAVLEGPTASPSGLYREWERSKTARGVPRLLAQPGLAIRLGNYALLEVLHPPEDPLESTGADTNNNSVVLRLWAGGVSFLLPGDLEGPGEDYLLASNMGLSATVLKAGHHGSDTSTSQPFLAAVSPRVAVVSVGAENQFGHPHREIVARLRRLVGDDLYLTSERGTIELATDGRKLWVNGSR